MCFTLCLLLQFAVWRFFVRDVWVYKPDEIVWLQFEGVNFLSEAMLCSFIDEFFFLWILNTMTEKACIKWFAKP